MANENTTFALRRRFGGESNDSGNRVTVASERESETMIP